MSGSCVPPCGNYRSEPHRSSYNVRSCSHSCRRDRSSSKSRYKQQCSYPYCVCDMSWSLRGLW